MTSLTARQDDFLEETRIGILCTVRPDGSPRPVPVWFEWDGSKALMFTEAGSPKIARLERDPRASLLVTNRVGEPENWVRLDGQVAIRREGAINLAERLARRYWDLGDPGNAATLETWRQTPHELVLLQLTPDRISSYSD